MTGLIERLQEAGTTRAEVRRLSRKPEVRRGRPRHFVFKLSPRGADFSLALHFKRAQVERAEIIRTLESVLESLRRSG